MINVKVTRLIRKLPTIKYCKRYFAGRLLALVTDPPPPPWKQSPSTPTCPNQSPPPVITTHWSLTWRKQTWVTGTASTAALLWLLLREYTCSRGLLILVCMEHISSIWWSTVLLLGVLWQTHRMRTIMTPIPTPRYSSWIRGTTSTYGPHIQVTVL